jgi:hypothetical protein
VQDLAGLSLVPGVYCANVAFILTGNLTLQGEGVWIFKTATTLITSPNSSVTGGNPCDVWWRVGSSVTLDTNTSFIGNILALNGVNAMNNGATLDGRLLVQAAGTVTLDSNTITTADCAEEEESTPTSTPPFVPDSGDSSTSTPVPTATRVATPSASPAASPTTRPAAPSQGQPPQVVPPQTGDAGLLRASQLLR